jgi:hypothetical protein
MEVGGRNMLRKLLVIVLLLGLVSFSGCLSKPIGYIVAAPLDLVHVDGVVYSFLGYGTGSPEFNQAVSEYGSHGRTYANNLTTLQEDFDKHFMGYDKFDPLSE